MLRPIRVSNVTDSESAMESAEMKNQGRQMRAGEVLPMSIDRATASTDRAPRNAADSVRRRTRRPPLFDVWGTMGPTQRNGKPTVCIWGTHEDAVYGCEPDEKVVRVRVEVLEVLDE